MHHFISDPIKQQHSIVQSFKRKVEAEIALTLELQPNVVQVRDSYRQVVAQHLGCVDSADVFLRYEDQIFETVLAEHQSRLRFIALQWVIEPSVKRFVDEDIRRLRPLSRLFKDFYSGNSEFLGALTGFMAPNSLSSNRVASSNRFEEF